MNDPTSMFQLVGLYGILLGTWTRSSESGPLGSAIKAGPAVPESLPSRETPKKPKQVPVKILWAPK